MGSPQNMWWLCLGPEASILQEKWEICSGFIVREYRFFIQVKCRKKILTFFSASQRIAPPTWFDFVHLDLVCGKIIARTALILFSTTLIMYPIFFPVLPTMTGHHCNSCFFPIFHLTYVASISELPFKASLFSLVLASSFTTWLFVSSPILPA